MRRLLAMALTAVSFVACAPGESPAQGGAASGPVRWRSEIAQADAAARRGDRREATRLATQIVGEYTRSGTRVSAEHVIAGRAYVLLSPGNASAARAALAAFDAGAADGTNLEAARRTGDLFLEKYNAPDARVSYESVLKRAPNDADALLGLAQVEEFEGRPTVLETLGKALAANPRLTGALAMQARLQLEAEAWDSAHGGRATRTGGRLRVDARLVGAWRGGVAARGLRRRSAAPLAAATALQPQPSDFYAELAEAAVRQRRYAEAVRLAQQAVSLRQPVGARPRRAGHQPAAHRAAWPRGRPRSIVPSRSMRSMSGTRTRSTCWTS